MGWGARSLGGAAFAATAVAVVALAAGPAVADPSVALSARTVRVGDALVVTTSGWPGPVTASLCGNAGRRGAVDCDQIGGVGIAASVGSQESRTLTVGLPPAPCPCVVRVSTAGDDVVRSAVIDVAGAGTAPVVEPDVAAPAPQVDAHLETTRDSFLTNALWLLFLVLAALVIDLGAITAVRIRRRRSVPLPVLDDKVTSRQTQVEQTSRPAIWAEGRLYGRRRCLPRRRASSLRRAVSDLFSSSGPASSSLRRLYCSWRAATAKRT